MIVYAVNHVYGYCSHEYEPVAMFSTRALADRHRQWQEDAQRQDLIDHAEYYQTSTKPDGTFEVEEWTVDDPIAVARGGTGDDGRMLPDGPLLRWLSGEDSEPDAALVQRIGKSLVQWSSPGWGGDWTDDQLAELLSDDHARRHIQRGVDAILDALKQEAGRGGRDALG